MIHFVAAFVYTHLFTLAFFTALFHHLRLFLSPEIVCSVRALSGERSLSARSELPRIVIMHIHFY